MAEDPGKLPSKPAGRARKAEVDAFLSKVAATPVSTRPGERGRLIFAMDATASREPAWDRACHIQGEMFQETAVLGGLELQLIYYRGFGECKASRWLTRSEELMRLMTGVFCLGGRTQIEKVLKRAIAETKGKRVNALVFVGDAMEEDVDRLCHLAGQLGMLGVPVFVFHEGDDPIARRTFQQIARLSNGACCRFDASSAQQLRDLLGAVAVFAAGGRKALDDYGRKKGGVALQITHQVASNK